MQVIVPNRGVFAFEYRRKVYTWDGGRRNTSCTSTATTYPEKGIVSMHAGEEQTSVPLHVTTACFNRQLDSTNQTMSTNTLTYPNPMGIRNCGEREKNEKRKNAYKIFL